MAEPLKLVESPELYFGFVSAVGAELDETILRFKLKLEQFGYNVKVISISKSFERIAKKIKPKTALDTSSEYQRIRTYIKFGNQLRKHYDNPAVLSSLAIMEVADHRDPNRAFEKTAYLIRQFKRKEEIDLLRQIYGRLFFQVSVFSRRAARVEYLSRKFAKDVGSGDSKQHRQQAEELILTDENEIADKYGQRVAKIFHDADFIVSTESLEPSVASQVDRFSELIFGSNSISPNKHEYGMFLAKAAALRTLDLSRQVGAAAFSEHGEVICLGSNEVPKAGGGTYWSDERFDDREYKRGSDSNEKRKRDLITEVLKAYDPKADIKVALDKKEIQDSQFMDALEYGRIIHAEMSAISDAARNGRSLRQSIMYTTTFPCHMCAKHIVAAGISKLVYLEPYPKSLAEGLHVDSIEFESTERGKYSKFPSVKFEHFFGVTPRRYRELFERNSRKTATGEYVPYVSGSSPQSLISIIYPLYQHFEEIILYQHRALISKARAQR